MGEPLVRLVLRGPVRVLRLLSLRTGLHRRREPGEGRGRPVAGGLPVRPGRPPSVPDHLRGGTRRNPALRGSASGRARPEAVAFRRTPADGVAAPAGVVARSPEAPRGRFGRAVCGRFGGRRRRLAREAPGMRVGVRVRGVDIRAAGGVARTGERSLPGGSSVRRAGGRCRRAVREEGILPGPRSGAAPGDADARGPVTVRGAGARAAARVREVTGACGPGRSGPGLRGRVRVSSPCSGGRSPPRRSVRRPATRGPVPTRW